MKNVIIVLIVSFISVSTLFAQTDKTTFGLEFGIKPFKDDNFTEKTLFSISGYIGFWGEVKFCDHFTTKFSAGLHNIYFRKYDINPNDIPHYLTTSPTKGDFYNRLELSVEPRFYLFKSAKSWGNCYAALPISVETAPLKGDGVLNLTMRILPSLGYRYNLSSHWFVEASAGIGWEKWLREFYSHSVFKYDLTAKIGYSF